MHAFLALNGSTAYHRYGSGILKVLLCLTGLEPLVPFETIFQKQGVVSFRSRNAGRSEVSISVEPRLEIVDSPSKGEFMRADNRIFERANRSLA